MLSKFTLMYMALSCDFAAYNAGIAVFLMVEHFTAKNVNTFLVVSNSQLYHTVFNALLPSEVKYV